MTFAVYVMIGCFVLMLAMVFLRIPIWIAMGASAVIGMLLIGGRTYTLQQMTTLPFYQVASYSSAVIPLFILMGVLASNCGLGETAYDSITTLTSSLPAGPLVATVFGSALIGACTGTGVASIAIFTKMSIPELKRRGYDRDFSLACIASASNIAVLIPPSVPIVFTCMITNISVGRTLMAGTIPGILVAVLMIGVLLIMMKLHPELIPDSKSEVSGKEKLKAIPKLLPLLIIFLVVVGGIYAGFFAPSVGGAVGAVAVLIYAIFKKTPFKVISAAFGEAVLLTGQVFAFLVTAYLFARLVALSRAPDVLLAAILAAKLNKYLVMGIIFVIFLILGCLMDVLPMLVIMLPVIFPLLTGMGFDETALAIIVVLLSSIGGITPPVGLGVFLTASMADVKPGGIFKHVMPFFAAMLVATILIVFIPGIATWLPNVLMN